jgi:hypothetical protein
MRIACRLKFLRLLVVFMVLSAPKIAFGDTMSSSSFVITSDDITTGGGNINSASFNAETDIGGKATGEDLASASFAACAGYPCTLFEPYLTFSVTPNSISLGNLSTGSVASGTTTITTTSNAWSGYVTTVATDGEFRTADSLHTIPGVTDGTVTAGSAEYGIGLTGSDRSFTDDRAISTTPINVAANGGSAENSAVVVTFKAAISSTVTAGNYSQIATFITTGTF